MKIIDPIYGQFEITEPVLLDLIDSAPLQRLKKIRQCGVPPQYFWVPGFSRYDHSIGVMLLLRQVGASLEEQVAGLLHDVSHTAFSHVIDWVIGDPSQEDYQDNQHLSVLRQPLLATTLARHGLTPEAMADYHRYTLLEQPLPRLCADRVDYTLREIAAIGRLTLAQECAQALRSRDGQLVFADQVSGQCFGEQYLDRQTNNWGSAESRLRYKLFAAFLKVAVDRGVITVDDFQTDDEAVMNKILASQDAVVLALLAPLETVPFPPEFIAAQAAEQLVKKVRYIDPACLVDDTVHALSDLNTQYRQALAIVMR